MAEEAQGVGDIPAAEDMVEAGLMAGNRRRREKAMLHAIAGDRGSMAGWFALRMLLWVSLVLGLGGVQAALAQESGQKTFNSATEASDAFATAVQNHDEAAMLAILGPSGRDVISSGDPVADQKNQDAFASKYRASHQFAAAGDGRTFLYIGSENGRLLYRCGRMDLNGTSTRIMASKRFYIGGSAPMN